MADTAVAGVARERAHPAADDSLPLRTMTGRSGSPTRASWDDRAREGKEQSWIAPASNTPADMSETQTVPSIVQHGAPITGGVVNQRVCGQRKT